ncbi:MAG: Jag N-terminal domain-containing protein [Desulfobulbus sp.]|nr:Jag N-terminal domain-containing protein [Desulfobulbus sp.]
MGKGKDFYGNDISEVIEQACKELGASREDLDIEVLETGSAGIFGLCKKKAHIRVQLKETAPVAAPEAAPPQKAERPKATAAKKAVIVPEVAPQQQEEVSVAVVERAVEKVVPQEEPPQAQDADEPKTKETDPPEIVEAPSEEALAAIQTDLHRLLSLMGLTSEVEVRFEDNTVLCHIQGPHEEQIVGPEGRTLDSLQYLLRKMVSAQLPDRIMLALNAGDFRERRAEELKIRAVELAAMVKADGKTQSIPALNPSERRVVHMVLQEDKGVRSRSVGEGLFKKVLIYKPGKGRRPASKKRRGGQGGRSTGD